MTANKQHTRSALMSRIRGRNTAPETVLRKALWARGMRYRIHARTPVGRPDVVFPGRRVAVFIDGCFWHGCPEHYVRPRTRNAFWDAKLADNVARDRRQTLELEAQGWRVVRVWEHEVFEALDDVVERVRACFEGATPRRRAAWRVSEVRVIDAASDLERRTLTDLRVAEKVRVVERYRTTKRWKRPADLYPKRTRR